MENLVNIENVGNKIYLWYVDEIGKLTKKIDENYRPYFYVEASQFSEELQDSKEYQTIDGNTVIKMFFNDLNELKEKQKEFEAQDISMWESDIDYVQRYLLDKFSYKVNTKLLPVRTWFLDIEVLVGNKFPEFTNPTNPITAISIYDTMLKKVITLAWHPTEYKKNFPGVMVLENETKMLSTFIELVKKLDPMIISGWNSEKFDYPYLLCRMSKIFDNETLRTLSTVGRIDISPEYERFKIYGRCELDYMLLYKKFSINERDSYSLNSVSQAELGEGKIEYKGKLDDLWKNDFAKFLEYNIQDVNLLKKLDENLKFIDLSRELTAYANIKLEKVFYNSMLNESLILTKIHKDGFICFDNPNKSKGHHESFAGGYVKDPIVGLHDWMFSLDLTSLYPSIIRTLNMSFDTLVLGDEKLSDDPNAENKINTDFYRSCNDQAFVKSPRGIIPTLLDTLFTKRIEYKKLMKKAEKENDEYLTNFYDTKQYTMKIFLNSIYGYLGMPSARFFDKRIAEGVTLTGQEIIKSSIKYVETRYKNRVQAIAADTDSMYLKILNMEDINLEKILEFANRVNNDVNTYLIKEFSPKHCNVFPENKEPNYFEFKFEKVMSSAIFLAKKRYAANVVWDEGFPPKPGKEIKVIGIEVVRSDTPISCRKFMKEVLTMILHHNKKEEVDKYILQFKKDIKKLPLREVGIPIGVNGINKYWNVEEKIPNENTLCKKGTPIQVRAAINYNAAFSKFGQDMDYPEIINSDKIKWFYIKPTSNYNVSVMAMKEGIEKHIEQFQIDWDSMLARLVDGKIETIYEPLNWGSPQDPAVQISDELFE